MLTELGMPTDVGTYLRAIWGAWAFLCTWSVTAAVVWLAWISLMARVRQREGKRDYRALSDRRVPPRGMWT